MRQQYVIVIPARLESERLPGKMLLRETGKTLIQHTWEEAMSYLSDTIVAVYVASDSLEILTECRKFGALTIMTDDDIKCGSDRALSCFDFINMDRKVWQKKYGIICWQGDYPEVAIDNIDGFLEALSKLKNVVGTYAYEEKRTEWVDFDDVKIATKHADLCLEAVYFSRENIPHDGDLWIHVGIYIFNPRMAKKAYNSRFSGSFHGCNGENLEQLRWMTEGIRMPFNVVSKAIGINNQKDYDEFIHHISRK